jgi:hypothetical protein
MLQAVVAIAVPVLVFLTMVIVGLQLTAPDFRRALRQPLLLTLAALGQSLRPGPGRAHPGIATAGAVSVLNRTEFAVFAAASFVAQVPLVIAAVALFRFRMAPAPAAVVEVGHP